MTEKTPVLDAAYAPVAQNEQGMVSSTSSRDHYRLIGLCSLLSFSVNFQYSFCSTYTNSAVQSFKSFINESMIREDIYLTNSQYSLLWNVIVNVWFVGFFVGIWLSRWMTDQYGRKPAFLTGCAFNVVGAVLSCVSIVLYQPILLIVGRLLSSAATSLSYCSLILYLQEVPPAAKRGATSCLNGSIYSLIAILGITLGNDQLLGKHLVSYMGFAIVPCVFGFFVIYIFPETPKFLVSRGNFEDAELSIVFYHGNSADVAETIKTIQHDVNCAESEKVSYIDLVKEKHLRNALWIALAALQNTVALWTILLSSTYYLEQSNVKHGIAQWSSSGMAVAYALGTTTSVVAIDRFGRRSLLLWSNILNMSSLVFYTLFAELDVFFPGANYGCLVALAIFGYSFGAGVGPVSRFIGAELVPLQYRSLLTAVVFSENTVLNTVTSFSCRPLFDAIGPYAFIVLYVIPSVFCVFYIFKYLPETKGRDIQEIVEILKKQ